MAISAELHGEQGVVAFERYSDQSGFTDTIITISNVNVRGSITLYLSEAGLRALLHTCEGALRERRRFDTRDPDFNLMPVGIRNV